MQHFCPILFDYTLFAFEISFIYFCLAYYHTCIFFYISILCHGIYKIGIMYDHHKSILNEELYLNYLILHVIELSPTLI